MVDDILAGRWLVSRNNLEDLVTDNGCLRKVLEVLRFWFTKDLKYAKGKPCKPYNSCLGEFFRVC